MTLSGAVPPPPSSRPPEWTPPSAGPAGTRSGGSAAPAAPGGLGVPVPAAEAQTYLTALRQWVAQRRADLSEVDSAILRLSSAEQTAITTDLTVALTFWKAINDRLTLLETTFDGGRVGAKEAERLSTLIHGRLDSNTTEHLSLPATGSLAVSLPEACRLLDSLTRTLQARASLAPGAAEATQRITVLRAGAERVRDQVPLVPAGPDRDDAAERLARLDRRVGDLVERARRGADVGGLIGPLEIDLAVLERDLIVAAAERANAAQDRADTRQQVEELDARAEAIRSLERRCIAAVTPAPHLAIPNVRALGPVPGEAAGLAGYRQRLDRVARALDLAHETYAAALAERDEIIGLAGAVGAMLEARLAAHPPDDEVQDDLEAIRSRLEAVLGRTPMPTTRARALAAAFQSYVDSVTRPPSRPGRAQQ
ncbi:hypothetical protein Intca_0546 [Intrasporangium calvum DSM 43043]|uniref:Uncharacterized protein n=1 Tax=Intrasporangium calvum (strain ATCC 23552 / DSM 43043 / JCM 3097 / NBRC 12989 / NCIMB 10167 / NRRL B-3866 / 7 KIP) TaxID=710696 RepID=E6S9B5_INTC7|nr:hypothetical protein Intca_0546 [Intrasporangium calvum DSM 43043]